MRTSRVWNVVWVVAGVSVVGACGSSADSAGLEAPRGNSDNPGESATGGASSTGGKAASAGGSKSTGGALGYAPGPGGASGGPVPGVSGPSAGGSIAAGGFPSAPEDAGVAPSPSPEVPPVVNPFTIVAHDPLSTFAADVDTASYDLFARSVSSGYLPDPATVRTEEFVNYFSYAYEAPKSDSEVPFTISLSAAPGFFVDGTNVLRVGIQGRQAPAFEKKPTNLVFLVDTSGSMQAVDKLPLVQRVARHTLDVLAPTDTVSIVRYAGDVSVALTPTPVSNRSQIVSVIDELAASGSTNGGAGIQLAYAQAEAGYIEGGINHVVMCTDGDFNVGVSDTKSLLALIAEKRKSGVTLTALGFGANPNDSMMNAVSDAGDGIYSLITGEEQADRYVEEKMLSTLVHIAKDVKIQVEWSPDAVYAYRLLGYETRAIADSDFRNDVVDAGEIGAGHRVTALYHYVPKGREIPVVEHAAPVVDGTGYDGPVEVKPGDMVLVKVRYKQPDAHEADPAQEVTARLTVAAVEADLAKTDPDMQWAVALGTFSELLRGSPYVAKTTLGPLGVVFDRTAGTDVDRVAFKPLYDKARTLLLAKP